MGVLRSRPLLIVVAVASACVLSVLAGAYHLTHEPAPLVRVRWRESLTPDRRAALERRFLLVRPVPHEGRTTTYELLDTRRSNIRSLVDSPEVEDTDLIDRNQAAVPFDAPYGKSWMWIGDRTPGLRTRGVAESIAIASVLLLAGSIGLLVSGRTLSRRA